MHLGRGQQQPGRVGAAVGHYRQFGNVRPRVQHAVQGFGHGMGVRRAVKVMLAEQRRRPRLLCCVPQGPHGGGVAPPLNVQGIHAPLGQQRQTGVPVGGIIQGGFAPFPRRADGHHQRLLHRGTHQGQGGQPIPLAQRVQPQFRQVRFGGGLGRLGLGRQVGKAAGKQRYNDAGRLGVQVQHKGTPLRTDGVLLYCTTI